MQALVPVLELPSQESVPRLALAPGLVLDWSPVLVGLVPEVLRRDRLALALGFLVGP